MTNSFWLTVYRHSFGARDTITGIPASQYTPTQAKVMIAPKGSALTISGVGYYPKTDALMACRSNYDEMDIVEQKVNLTLESVWWIITARRDIMVGNTYFVSLFDLVKLERNPIHIFTSNLQGFETISDTHKFEDGFERVYVTS
jgi:hypothetical protein